MGGPVCEPVRSTTNKPNMDDRQFAWARAGHGGGTFTLRKNNRGACGATAAKAKSGADPLPSTTRHTPPCLVVIDPAVNGSQWLLRPGERGGTGRDRCGPAAVSRSGAGSGLSTGDAKAATTAAGHRRRTESRCHPRIPPTTPVTIRVTPGRIPLPVRLIRGWPPPPTLSSAAKPCHA